MTLSRGRDLLAIPGPSVIPDKVLSAMHRPAPNIYEGELVEMTASITADLKRVARTDGGVAIYIGNGHAGWEAAIANLLAPGERALVLATGRFGLGWAAMAEQMGVDVEILDFGFRAVVDPDRLADRLRADRSHEIRAVLLVQTDTASSVCNDVASVRAALDSAGHPALLAVDSIAGLACDMLEMDGWGADVVVAGSQKGLMTPPGLAFCFVGPRAAERRRVPCPSPYWDWGPRLEPEAFYQLFCGTAPTHHLYGLRTALDMILAEGIEAVWARHAVLASAVWAAADAWKSGGAVALNIDDPALRSHAVTTFRTGRDEARRLRRWCSDMSGLTLGIGLSVPGVEAEDLFRIGHMGHLNPPMLLGALATIDAGLKALGIAHGPGALDAAAAAVAAAAEIGVERRPAVA